MSTPVPTPDGPQHIQLDNGLVPDLNGLGWPGVFSLTLQQIANRSLRSQVHYLSPECKCRRKSSPREENDICRPHDPRMYW